MGEDTARDLTVGIMGMGALGAAAAPMLRGLGYRVAGWSRGAQGGGGGGELRGGGGAGRLPRAGGRAGLPAARDAGDGGDRERELLAKLRPGAGFVNAARGAHAVVPDLVAALNSGQLSGAVLDVFDPEPLPAESPLWSHPKVTVTPHVASVARRRERARYVAEAIAGFEAGGPLPNLYDPVRGY